ncbi:hypothetical protein GLOTRDRAFT_111806 [Gloeophyllum trabeum ATCC 11539]|uniref:Bromo domain-containing protein n=1 Tax=Gloeophyllum trabeum (strain ATCC 11539 / FP-39264 / Madison 617) TaxID=670483 RepID=S7Q0L0_GLOTA|nr:uncharacterized protein GLOTRDRAFT_111806 [Gloeophyllum trabeum ATCC 11539]EPQ52987.1 hypothetical protein GLOTRDRAFT_111806 [Gloeophyllum trabeum ATCC 11539]
MSSSSSSSPDPGIDAVGADDVNKATSRPSGSGIKLVLPPLKAVKPLKRGKKSKGSTFVQDEGVRKAPRPVKLKPLKEVLAKLIAQIKKKDDYAFFLRPVDEVQVPNYRDVIKQPMDFGTMTEKVNKGRYRSLDEFSNDFHLVTNNAKTFNPPGTIHHIEAARIEAWGEQHIEKARLSVIEHEADWNIDIEREDSVHPVGDEDRGTPMDIDGTATNAPSPSVTSAAATPAPSRRRRKVPQAPGTISESIDEEGRLPGSKDGLGAFPYGSDWAALMLSLKLKGKKKRTKKERLRLEKGGPPFAADGSLDYVEMDEPFSALSVFAPEPLEVPRLMPLYSSPATSDSTHVPYVAPVNLPLEKPMPSIDPSLLTPPVPPRRRHWTVNRNAYSRGRGKEREEDDTNSAPGPEPREAHALDYGSFSVLLGKLEEEMRTRGTGGYSTAVLNSEQKVKGAIHSSLQASSSSPVTNGSVPDGWNGDDYWDRSKAAEAQEILRAIVYGGVEGLAYLRSVAEFVTSTTSQAERPSVSSESALGMPLAAYVEKHIIDPLTGGRHRLLSETVSRLSNPKASVSSEVAQQVPRSVNVYPHASRALSLLRSVVSYPIDMASLIRSPNELFVAESEWVGANYREKLLQKEEDEKEKKLVEEPGRNAAEYLAFAIKNHQEATISTSDALPASEGPEVYQYALDSVTSLFDELEQRRKETGSVSLGQDGTEDPVARKVRLSLLALAKRAPLDKIAKLPPELVPAHLRHVVPTLGA